MNTEVLHTEWVGSVVDRRFPLLQLMGSSGPSSVYLTELDGDPEQKAIIKLIPADAEGAHSRAVNWAAAATVSHPHLIRVYHSGSCWLEDTEYLYAVTEYAPEVLSEILPERHLTASEAREMLGPILDALSYLHEHGFIHGRVKPSNILAVDDHLKLSADAVHLPASPARQGAILQVYDAPEWSEGPIGPAADIWSLGVTLVEALSQIPPVWNRSSGSDPIVPPSLPETFPQIVRECLRRDPTLRCSTSELRASLGGRGWLPRRGAKVESSESRSQRAKNKLIAIVTVCAAVLLAGFVVVLLRTSRSPSPARTAGQAAAVRASTPAPSQPLPTSHPAAAKASAPSVSPTPPVKQPVAPASTPVQVAAAAPASAPASVAHNDAPAPPPAARVTHGPAVKGSVAQQVLPDVPARASQTIHGTVRLAIRVNVDLSGTVIDATIDNQGPSQYFTNLALKAARSWRFTPPEVNGQGVPSVWLLRFEFQQSGVDVASAEVTP